MMLKRPPLRSRLFQILFVLLAAIITSRLISAQQVVISQPVAVPSDLAWNQNGDQLAVARVDGTLEILSRTERSPVNFDIFTGPLTSVAWSPIQNNRLAVSANYGSVQLLDITGEQFSVVLDLETQQNDVHKVTWSPDGTRVATVGERDEVTGVVSEIKIWDPQNGSVLTTYLDGYSLTDIAWNPESPNQLLVTGVADYEGAEMLLWDVSTNTVLWNISEPNSLVLEVAWNPDGNQFVSAMNPIEGAVVRVHSAQTGAVTSIIPTGLYRVGAIAWNPSAYLAVLGPDVIQIWDTAAVQAVNSIPVSDIASDLSWSPSGELAFSRISGTIEISTGLVPTPTPSDTPTP